MCKTEDLWTQVEQAPAAAWERVLAARETAGRDRDDLARAREDLREARGPVPEGRVDAYLAELGGPEG